MIAANVKHFQLPDPAVHLRLSFYKKEAYWDVPDGSAELTEAEAEEALADGRYYGGDENLWFSCRRVRSNLAGSLTSPVQASLSEALATNAAADLAKHPTALAFKASGFEAAWDTEVLLKGTLTVIGQIDCDRMFVYTGALKVRDMIGWAWVSSLGQSKLIDADLDAAATKVTRYVRDRDGRADLDTWSKLINEVYRRDVTTRFDGSSLINPTLAVATRLLTRLEHPGFNICW